MDGVGPVRQPDPKVFLNPPVWHRDQKSKPKPQPSAEADEPEDEDEESQALAPEEHGLDLEA